MARLFISFAIEDIWARDYLVGQARNERTPFEFVDMSVKQPWESAWKTNCRTRIRGCAGVIALVSRNTKNASGQLWEINCARQEGKPVLGIYTTPDARPQVLPAELAGISVRSWTWENITNFLNRLR